MFFTGVAVHKQRPSEIKYSVFVPVDKIAWGLPLTTINRFLPEGFIAVEPPVVLGVKCNEIL